MKLTIRQLRNLIRESFGHDQLIQKIVDFVERRTYSSPESAFGVTWTEVMNELGITETDIESVEDELANYGITSYYNDVDNLDDPRCLMADQATVQWNG